MTFDELKAPSMRSKLHQATDELNEAIIKAEAAFESLGLGVSASVLLVKDPETFLELKKCNKGWKLMVFRVKENDEQLLTSSSRALRLLACSRLGDMFDSTDGSG